MDELDQQILAVLDRPTGIGIFSRAVEVPGKARARHWFSMSSGLASLQEKIMYRSRFSTLPDWVSLCHPDHQIGLCRLALGGDRALPAVAPLPGAAKTGGGDRGTTG